MHILTFIKRATPSERRWLVLLAVVAGLANALLVVVINHLAGLVAEGQRPSTLWWLGFAGVFAVYFVCQKIALTRANAVVARLLKRLRLELVDKIRQGELQSVDRVGRGELISMLTQTTNHLAETFPILIDCFQQSVLLLVALLYLAYLSMAAFLVFVGAVAVGIVWYLQIDRTFRETLQLAGTRQAQLLDTIGDIIRGAKELRLNSRKSDAVLDTYRGLSRSAGSLLSAAGEHWAAVIALGFVVTYFILGVVVFVLPEIDKLGPGTTLFQLIPIVLFCLSPLSRIVEQSAMFVQADVELQSIFAAERRLDEADGVSTSEARTLARGFDQFHTITYAGITFNYRNDAGAVVFTSGPWDLTVKRGETIFLVGGNGSGKSTLLKAMTGLYHPQSGAVTMDGTLVTPETATWFRSHFAAVFSEYHLFDRLYGLGDVPLSRVNELLTLMQISHKTAYENGRFTTLDLSHGQRKRLALLVALLEDRPILVLDEWAADQDPPFRQYFYETLLPQLKREGKTIIAVTHDDKYFDLADRVVKMEYGAFVPYRPA